MAVNFTKEKAVRTASSNLIKVTLDIEEYFKRFELVYVKIAGFDDENKDYRDRVIEVSNAARSSGVVRASLHYKPSGELSGKYFMIDKGRTLDMPEGFNLEYISASDVKARNLRFVLEKLLCHSVPSLISADERKVRNGFIHEERYCRVVDSFTYDVKDSDGSKTGQKTIALKAVYIEPDSDWLLWTGKNVDTGKSGKITTYLKFNSMLFREAAHLTPNQLKGKPRYDMSSVGFIHRTLDGNNLQVSGEYVQQAFSGKKSNVNGYAHDNEGNVDPDVTRAGAAYLFVKDINKILGDIITIELVEHEFDANVAGSAFNGIIEREYRQINSLLSKKRIFLINKSEKAKPANITEQIRKKTKFDIKIVDDVPDETGSDDIFLLITDTKEHYEEANETDPYKQFKAANPGLVSQNMTLANIFPEGELNEAALDKILGDIVFKMEVLKGKFLIDRPNIEDGTVFILPHRSPCHRDCRNKGKIRGKGKCKCEDRWKYIRCDVNQCRMEYKVLSREELHLLCDFLGENACRLIGRRNSNGNYTNDRSPLAITNDGHNYIFFVQTSMNAMPNFDLIENSTAKSIAISKAKVEREFFERCVAFETYSNTVTSALKAMLVENNDSHFSRSEFDKYIFRNDIIKPIKDKLKAAKKSKVFYAEDIEEIEEELKEAKALKPKFKCKKPLLEAISESYYVDIAGEKHGVYWHNSKSNSDRELFMHFSGFNMSTKSQIYYAGEGRGVSGSDHTKEKLCVIYKLVSNMTDGVGAEILEWFMSGSIRNKQTTARPFIFKHIAEFGAMLDSGTIIVDEYRPKALVENIRRVKIPSSITAVESTNNIEGDEDYTSYLAD
ncbi:hypothetical protein [Vibrio sp. SCSIO 43136]|uniref:hypothetical protein n=1 Tax=Vibrio sp. SCSIO 43136 TaxID=2819101 RepID=UPI00207601E6|nr:hypothetical protein [Vibrio sp. SCSIO 43136]USD67370.1 hypothetical protein J4N39_22335 [Vibrio sp. SCSIO 43136]